MKETSIEISWNPDDVPEFSVKVNGEEIQRLRSFEIRVSNEPRSGAREGTYYKAEQYLPVQITQEGNC